MAITFKFSTIATKSSRKYLPSDGLAFSMILDQNNTSGLQRTAVLEVSSPEISNSHVDFSFPSANVRM